jgi:hypothetical protein
MIAAVQLCDNDVCCVGWVLCEDERKECGKEDKKAALKSCVLLRGSKNG